MTSEDVPTVANGTATDRGPAVDARRQLDRSLARGVAWTGTVRWLTQLATWASTLVVVRLLTPEDYGLVGLATLYLGVVTMLSEFGIGTTVIALRELTPDQHAQINTMSMMFGVAAFAVSCAAAPLLARFFDAPELTRIVIAMASVFVVTGARVVPQALLQREMRFRDLALNDGLQAVVLATGSVVFALLGFRYWTLVLSALLAAVLSTLGVLRLVRVPFHRPQWRALAPALTFSRHTLLSRLAWYAYQNADFLVVGRLFGKELTGVYRVAWDLTSTPIEKITAMVSRVTPAVLSAAQHDRPALRRYLLRITEALAVVTFPATVGMGLVARDLVPLLLTEKWAAMVLPLQLLAVAAAVRSVTPMLPQVLTVIGENRRVMHQNVVGAIVMPLAFWAGSRWGTVGIAAMWLAVYPVAVVGPMGRAVFRQLHMRGADYGRALAPAVTGVVVMSLLVWGVRWAMPIELERPVRLAMDIGVGAAGYCLALLVFFRSRVAALVAGVRAARA